MSIKLLNGIQLYHAIISGAHKLINEKLFLNKINVFPVPDGDTGSNMASLMLRIVNDAKAYDHLGKTMESISSAAIAGSRGNSGIIFSEYLNGVYEGVKELETANVNQFHNAVLNGVKKAYNAIFNPVEGTILTVFRKAFHIEKNVDDFSTYFATVKVQALKALKETPDELEVLKLNKVVDAGANGLTLFLDGVNYYFENGVEQEVIEEQDSHSDHDHHPGFKEVLTHRYCSEALLQNCKIGPNELKILIKDYGTSLVVSGRKEKMRVHIHTNEPDVLFLKLREYGEIIEQKVDDMIRQQQATQEEHPKIAILTDSIADIPLTLADQYHIHMLPLYLMIDGVSYLDKYSITTKTFYQMLDKGKAFSSSLADKLTIERNLQFLMQNYEHVLVITVASKLSGTYNAIAKFAESHPQVKVFDSKQNSGAQGLVVLHAAKMAFAGHSIEEILQELPSVTARTKIFVSVRTLKYMVRQGRISKVTGIIGKIINLKPVIGLGKQGEGVIVAKSFSLGGNVRAILKLVKKEKVLNYAIVHSLDEKRAMKLAQKVEKITGLKPDYIEMISPIVAMNAGIGAVAIALTYEKEID